MEIQDFHWKLKSVGEQGQFSGLAAVYGNVDLGGDVILANAFSRTIASQPPMGVPILWVHDQASPLGVGKLSDSAAGLVIDGTLELEDPTAQKAYRFMKSGAVRGLSIGFDPVRSKTSYDFDSGVRTLGEVKVYEVSLCAVPMNQSALVTNIKSLDAVERVLRNVHDVSDPAVLSQLKQIDTELKRLLGNVDEEDDDEELLALQQFATSLKALAGE
jgi:HK97 family phage prohead protease